ncbi:MAG: diadenylate cyclase [Deltaproteobacteria bacterium]|nr:diadenylate cyclase [Deltaproteobacteria bacterium]
MADGRIERAFVKTALALASRPEVDRLVYVGDSPLATSDLRGRPIKRKLVYAVTTEALAHQLLARKFAAVVIPPFGYSRVEKVRVALVACQSEGLVKEGDTVLALAGHDRSLDTLVRIRIGADDDEDRVQVNALDLPETHSVQVIEQVILVALEVGAQGYEGHPVGTIFIVGASPRVMEQSRQITLNPFQGMSESERNVMDPTIREALKTFAVLDGAFVIREDGTVLAAGRYLQAGKNEARLPAGLGARHRSAAAVTATIRGAIAVTVSQTTGTVRVFRDGQIILELRQTSRRV